MLALLACFVLGVQAGVTNDLLCGQWKEVISPANGKNCSQKSRCMCTGMGCPRVTEQFSFNANNHTFVHTHQQFRSSACQIQVEDFYVEVGGNYTLGQDTLTNWTGITYVPTWFLVRVTSSAGYPPDSADESQCIDLLLYLNNDCPCNGTWTQGVSRTIVKADCPPNTCNDTQFVLDDRSRYGNVQIEQNTTNRFLILTTTQLNQSAGFDETTPEFTQISVCGRGCKTCSQGFNCVECCTANAEPIPSPTESKCQCKAKYHNQAQDNFTLNCTSAAPASFSYSISVFAVIILSLLLCLL